MECKEEENGQMVIPVFYDVDRSHVRYQRYDIRDRIESECIRELVDDVSSKLCKTSSSYLHDIVGIDTLLEKVTSLLEMETNDVLMVGIWGMGGVVVLDDINHHDHWEYLAGDLCWFDNGSRIIATTRNKQIIGKNNVVYEVTTLRDAIRLFSQYAFKDKAPDEHIKKLALEVVSQAKGLPLALRLWGILLHNEDATMWRDVVDMIKRESSPYIVKTLKISFEGLPDKENHISRYRMLQFRGRGKYKTIKILESYDLGARIRLHGLIEKSLVFISKYNTIQMHDLVQDMGRYVAKMQKDSGKPSRLWNIEDFEDVVSNTVNRLNTAI
ncbi:hypothetical protein KY290_027305 [Solanum tuberosum]|uniref:TIR domain-containing protein n=1 Tax=Solanum tuberosum TaxID=4113 RepID=A0ABQ7UGF6_SOLTU|nr:hypothetical protein KY290_027305 [Solanum tuberosum]